MAEQEKEFLDKLERAQLMEEEMASHLVDLCHPDSLPDDIPQTTRKRIADILTAIKADTARHRQAVLAAKARAQQAWTLKR